jgi:hypothetical protein
MQCFRIHTFQGSRSWPTLIGRSFNFSPFSVRTCHRIRDTASLSTARPARSIERGVRVLCCMAHGYTNNKLHWHCAEHAFRFRHGARIQIRHIFLKFSKIWRIWDGLNLKITEFTVHCFKISEKDKNQQKICKKTRSNSKVIGEEIFVKPSHLCW